ncbi:MAG: hypothetical protein HXY23_14360 [Parvularculaceae bacterium]|nr:hypothetical protein [Parvularculaceae bacterium]
MTIIETSKGPVNIETFVRATYEVNEDTQAITSWTFHLTSGALVLGTVEGGRLAAWLGERAVFDATASPEPQS